jgi:spermidine synthase
VPRILVLVLFFVSGAAGLVYEVTWARSLGLVFGASHLAVTTVLAVYMGGQALGSALFGRAVDRTQRPLRLYGWIEVGVAISAFAFLGILRVYPVIYPPVARLAEGSGAWLTMVRIAFAVLAMIVPTTLMGGTLPVLTRFAAGEGVAGARHLASLYAVNTFGALTGTLLAGFLLLPALGVTVTLLVAAGASALVGVVALVVPSLIPSGEDGGRAAKEEPDPVAVGAVEPASDRALRTALVAIAASGFCALGYEVLWTRMLTLVVGTSVYSFTVMLVAFLGGIGVGSHAFRPLRRWVANGPEAARALGITQILIGLSALGVTLAMSLLPSIANHLRNVLEWKGASEFAARLVGSLGVGLAFMFVPAFLMGLAFPLAGAVWMAGRKGAGATVGKLLTANTLGAILGATAAGFALIRWFGIERSLQMLVLVNVGIGLLVLASLSARRRLEAVVLVATAVLLVARAATPSWGRVWDSRYFATYVNVGRSTDTPAVAREKQSHLEVLYFHEGVNETVSVTRSRGGEQSFIVNGRPEASNVPIDVQLQKALGHLPMLLHPDPRRVFVLGTGTGMTLGATAIHPEVQRLVLGEIEEGVLGVARTFSEWNNRVLDDPKLQVVLNDGRNFLATTTESFDVITADPIHPWSGGAGYLYTEDYFRAVARRLAPGGIAAQWLPLYELTPRDVRTVVRTFARVFPYTMLWLTYYDAVLVGSESPITIDEERLSRRMGVPRIRDDLRVAGMATPDDLLSYFLFASGGAREFGRGGDVNTDDNVVLEFSAPASQGITFLEGANVAALAKAREPLLPFLVPAPDEAARARQREHWTRRDATGRRFDELHARFLAGEREGPVVDRLRADLRSLDPGYAPLRFLEEERTFGERTQPHLVAEGDVPVAGGAAGRGAIRISVVCQYLGRGSALISIVDNARREVYAQGILDAPYDEMEGRVGRFAVQSLDALRAAARGAGAPGDPGPAAEPEVVRRLREEATRLVAPLGRPAAG